MGGALPEENPMPHRKPAFRSFPALRWTVAVALALLLASPLAAYTIYLKSGRTMLVKGKYQIKNGKAYVTLPNGTEGVIDASEIDIPKTDSANKADYGNAEILDVKTPNTPPSQGLPPQRKLSDLIRTHEASRDLPGARREAPAAADTSRALKTRAGYPDFAQTVRRPYPQTEVTAELQQFFHGQSVDDVEIYVGSRSDRPLIEITAGSEGSVFRALSIAANALLHIRDTFPNKVAAFELLLTTPNKERAGQFVITPEMASDLVAKKVELTAFYVQNVQF
jgi:hypothetical protein